MHNIGTGRLCVYRSSLGSIITCGRERMHRDEGCSSHTLVDHSSHMAEGFHTWARRSAAPGFASDGPAWWTLHSSHMVEGCSSHTPVDHSSHRDGGYHTWARCWGARFAGGVLVTTHMAVASSSRSSHSRSMGVGCRQAALQVLRSAGCAHVVQCGRQMLAAVLQSIDLVWGVWGVEDVEQKKRRRRHH